MIDGKRVFGRVQDIFISPEHNTKDDSLANFINELGHLLILETVKTDQKRNLYYVKPHAVKQIVVCSSKHITMKLVYCPCPEGEELERLLGVRKAREAAYAKKNDLYQQQKRVVRNLTKRKEGTKKPRIQKSLVCELDAAFGYFFLSEDRSRSVPLFVLERFNL